MTLFGFIQVNLPTFMDRTIPEGEEGRKLFLTTLIEAVNVDPVATEAFSHNVEESCELLRAIWAALHYATMVDAHLPVIEPLVKSLIAFIHESIEW